MRPARGIAAVILTTIATVTAGALCQPAAAKSIVPSQVRLGAHQFGHLRGAEAIVARARPGDVGFVQGREGAVFGPWSFDVARDGSVWLLDQVNDRLLVWRPGRPDRPARSVPLPFTAAMDFVVGPDGTVFVTAGGQAQDALYALRPTGQLRWKAPLPTDQVVGSLLMHPDGTVYYHYHDEAEAWTPLTDTQGRPLPVAEQRRRTGEHQPLPGALRLVTTVVSGRERHFITIDRAGDPVRAWRVTSRTELGAIIGTPTLIGRDLVVTIEVIDRTATEFQFEFLTLRLAPDGGIRQRFALDARAVWGDRLTDLRIGPDGRLYQLRTSPTTGVRIARYSLDAARPTPPAPPTTIPGTETPDGTVPPATNPPPDRPGAPEPTVVEPPVQPAAIPAAMPAARPAAPWIILGLAALGSGALAALGFWLLNRGRHPTGRRTRSLPTTLDKPM